MLDRRQVLHAGVTAAVATSLSQSLHAVTPEFAGYIDAHSHIWTRDVKNYPLTDNQGLEVLDPPSFTTEELLAVAQKHDVQRVVLIAHGKFYRFDNSYMTDTFLKYPGRFRVVAMVDDASKDPSGQMKKLQKLGATGFRITPKIRGRDKWLNNDGMESMWKTAAETGQAMCCLIDCIDLPAVKKMCAKHPDTKVVIDHFARVGIDGEIPDKDVKLLASLAKHKNVHVKISAYYALGKKKPPHLELLPMIKRLVEAYGCDRLMWASDAPYQIVGENNYTASIDLIRKHADFLSDAQRLALLRGTAEKVFFGS
jgi:predicted TIM-barrel fold metal-dependent hydrolase